MVKKCGGCSTVVDNGFDSALMKYLRETPPEFTNSEPAYFSIVNPYLHEKIRNASLPANTQNLLNKTIASMVSDMKIQVREQMDAFRDVS
jgi:hypothetical protein